MSLRKGDSRKAIGANIRTLKREGKSGREAVAIALRTAGVPRATRTTRVRAHARRTTNRATVVGVRAHNRMASATHESLLPFAFAMHAMIYHRENGRRGQVERRERTRLGQRLYRIGWDDGLAPATSVVEKSWLRTRRRGLVPGRAEHAFIQDYDRRHDETPDTLRDDKVHCLRRNCHCPLLHMR